jgi:pyridoxamine 5'-phosphate oxidase
MDLTKPVSIKELREKYKATPLLRDELCADPIDQFALWYRQAQEANLRYPNAMSLATVSFTMEVSSRIVLLRYFDQGGFTFFSGFQTKKAEQIAANPRVALLFPWLDLERQVKITGLAEKISATESLKFFATRSRDSQVGAWLTQSSDVISSRNFFKSKLEEIKEAYRDKKIPLPGGWGGYRVQPETVEFWQGHSNGLHDRFVYSRVNNGNWEIKRLLP